MAFGSLVGGQEDVNTVFRALADKYALAVPDGWVLAETLPDKKNTITLVPGTALVDASGGGKTCCPCDSIVPLFPWRKERRFVELAKLVASKTVEEVVMCRFSCTVKPNDLSLAAILYREFDLLEWFNDSRIVSLYASITLDRFANILVRLENGCVCSVEVGTTLPDNAEESQIDRHELIGRRGVASDRVVDTQIPQNSVYIFQDGRTERYTDVDAELFGLTGNQINLVRAGYDYVYQGMNGQYPTEENTTRHHRLTQWVQLAFESNRLRQHMYEKDASSLSGKGGCQ